MGLNALIDSRDVKFVLYEILEADKLGKYEKFSAFDKDTYDATLELAEQIAVEQLYPASAEAEKPAPNMTPNKIRHHSRRIQDNNESIQGIRIPRSWKRPAMGRRGNAGSYLPGNNGLFFRRCRGFYHL